MVLLLSAGEETAGLRIALAVAGFASRLEEYIFIGPFHWYLPFYQVPNLVEFPLSVDLLDTAQTHTALRYLASFHAFYWDNPPAELSAQGSYWYLDTRLKELEDTRDRAIYRNAHALDRKVKVSCHRFLSYMFME